MTSQPYLDRLRQEMGARYAPDTVAHTLVQAAHFLNQVGVKEHYSREDVVGYADYLLARGFRSSSVQTILTQVKMLFRAIGHPWPLDKGSLHLPPSEAGGPILSTASIAAVIRAARWAGQPEVGVTALSSIFGLRAIELERIVATGLAGQQLIVQTAKGGHRRRHQIPPALSEILTFGPSPLGRGALQLMFRRLVKIAGQPVATGEGWHAVRRAVVTGLLSAGLDGHKVEAFMGWRTGRTIASYYRPEAGRLDQEVFGLHPFLPMWNGLVAPK